MYFFTYNRAIPSSETLIPLNGTLNFFLIYLSYATMRIIRNEVENNGIQTRKSGIIMEDNSRVVDRIFIILEILAYAQKPLSLAMIVKQSNLSKTTVHRMLQTLLEKGYASKNLDGNYTLGAKFIELASYHINSLELQTEANPFLSLLYSQLNLSVHLGVLDGFKLVYITKLDIFPTTRSFARIGYETPAYCSSIGKILLAMLSGEDLEAFLNQCEFQNFTKNTITNATQLKKHLKQVRKQSWAMDDEESQLDHRCIAVPIYDYRGVAIASVGVSGNMEQLSNDKLPTIIRELTQTAQQISKRMGYT